MTFQHFCGSSVANCFPLEVSSGFLDLELLCASLRQPCILFRRWTLSQRLCLDFWAYWMMCLLSCYCLSILLRCTEESLLTELKKHCEQGKEDSETTSVLLCSTGKYSYLPPQEVRGNSKGDVVAKARRLKEKYEAKFEFLEGWGANQKSFVREGSVGVMDFFYNHTLGPFIQ